MTDIKIKGPSLKYILDFIEDRFSDKYDVWFENLPAESKNIFREIILSSNWYDLNFGHIIPIKTLGDVFFNGDFFKAAYEMGKFGGKKALGGIYKIFIRIPSLDFIVKKVSNITSTYYSEGIKIDLVEHTHNNLSLKVNGFYVGQELMMPNISGWLDNLMSIILKKEYKIKYESKPIENEKIEGFIDIEFF